MRLTRKQKEEQAIEDLINQMFIIAGHEVTFDDVKDRKDAWYLQWTMTTKQNKELKKWGTDYLRKKFRTTKAIAEHQMEWFCLQYGLKFSDFPNIN